MFKDIGNQIRTLRKKKGLGLEELATTIGVSRGYLSNLETGKTDSIQMSILEKLQHELNLFPEHLFKSSMDEETEFDIELKRIIQLLKQLNNQDPKEAEFLFHMIEKRFEIFSVSSVESHDKI